jgi:hypothetical protein
MTMGLIQIPIENLTKDGVKLVTEASTAGIPPGCWPDFVAVTKKLPNGSEEGFLFGPHVRNIECEGELVARVYTSRTNSLELHILND